MEGSTPVRKTRSSTADLLTWSETPPPADHPSPNSAARRINKPSGGISPALFGGQMTEEEAQSVNIRKLCSGPKLREMTGSGIFAADNEDTGTESRGSLTNSCTRTGSSIYQQAFSGFSQISFNAEEIDSPKKPISLPEVAKQRELSGTLESEADVKVKKQLSDAKNKELSGHNIFGPPPETPPRVLAARNFELMGQLNFGERRSPSKSTSSMPAVGQRNLLSGEESVIKTAKKMHNHKLQDLTGNDNLKGEAMPESTEKPLSLAKLKEITGSDIFSDGKSTSRDYFGGVRKPPGGGSSIALV